MRKVRGTGISSTVFTRGSFVFRVVGKGGGVW